MKQLISVILCTHNPRHDYLRRVLDALKRQTLPLDKWEFLLIDNSSRERVADAWDISWHPSARHIREDIVGLTPARLRGINESGAPLLVFIDDDNVLAPDFLERAAAVSNCFSFLGAFGAGTLEPEFEIPPPQELTSSLGMLALRTVPSTFWSNNIEDFQCIPWGAGLCVTRDVADKFQEFIALFNATAVIGRQGKHLFSGEDDVFSWAAVSLGKGFGVFPDLQITHLISAGRLNRDYFLRLMRDHAFSHGVLRYLRTKVDPRQVGLARYIRILLHGLKRGLFSMRCSWAVAQGDSAAARFIVAKNLSSINLSNAGIESRQPTTPLS